MKDSPEDKAVAVADIEQAVQSISDCYKRVTVAEMMFAFRENELGYAASCVILKQALIKGLDEFQSMLRCAERMEKSRQRESVNPETIVDVPKE